MNKKTRIVLQVIFIRMRLTKHVIIRISQEDYSKLKLVLFYEKKTTSQFIRDLLHSFMEENCRKN